MQRMFASRYTGITMRSITTEKKKTLGFEGWEGRKKMQLEAKSAG